MVFREKTVCPALLFITSIVRKAFDISFLASDAGEAGDILFLASIGSQSLHF